MTKRENVSHTAHTRGGTERHTLRCVPSNPMEEKEGDRENEKTIREARKTRPQLD